MSQIDVMPVNHQANHIDLVVVGFTGELRALKLQARSLRLYASEGMFTHIYIIVNDNAFSAFRTYFETEILPEYGVHANCVELVDYRALTGKPIKKTGWRSQQALKLLAARLVNAPQYLLLDSKNHIIRPIDSSTFVSIDGKLRMHQTAINPLFRSHFDAACTYFGVKDGYTIEQALPTTTPLIMSTRAVRQLLDNVERRQLDGFMLFFLQNRSFNEFYFYHAYLLSQPELFETIYQSRSKTAVVFFGGAAETPERIKFLMPALDRQEICCTGVHRHILEVGLEENLQAIAAMWRRFGLVNSEWEIDYFQTYTPPVKPKKYIFF